MALPIPPINPNNRIPNNPFFSPEVTYFCGPYFPSIITSNSGIVVNPDGTISVTGGGGAGVSSLTEGPGIALSGTTGAITVCTNIVGGTNIALTQVGNQITISSSGGGSVTAVAAGNGLTATSNPITTSGTIALNTNCVIQPSAFNAKGDLLGGTGSGAFTALPTGTNGQVLIACSTAGATGLCWGNVGTVTLVSGIAPIAVATGTSTPSVSIAAASTTGSGAVQLNDTLISTSTDQALTAAQGKVLQDQITALVTSPNITLAGTIDASTGLVLSVTSAGIAAGYTQGSVLPAAFSGTVNTYVIVTEPGTLTPPGGSSTVATRGDWFLVSELGSGLYEWEFLNVGFDAPAASTTVPGIVELATNAETQTGTDATLAVTPAGLASAYIPKSELTAKGDLISATAASTPIALSVGSDGQILAACSTATTGLCWVPGIAQATPDELGTVYACTTVGIAAVGFCSANNTTGAAGNSVAVGVCALFSSVVPNQATAVGSRALFSLTTGCQNVAVGNFALAANMTGQGNSALGWCSLGFATGCFNTALGHSAGSTVTSGICNVLIGSGAQPTDPTDNCTLRIGWETGNYWICGDDTKAIKPGAGIIDCANSCGTAGQVLMSNGSNAICWGTAVSSATPTAEGTVYACTDSESGGCASASLGESALGAQTTGCCNSAVGSGALGALTSGERNVAIGFNSGRAILTESDNVAIGTNAGLNCGYSQSVLIGSGAVANNNFAGADNTIVGYSALNAGGLLTSVNTSVILGVCALSNTDYSASQLVAIGPNVSLPNPSSSCQLAIGYAAGQNWLTGDSNKHIRPGAGLRDCAGNLGTNGQVLTSTGSALQWRNLPGCEVIRGSTASITYGAGFVACTVRYNTAINDTTGWYNGTTGVFQPNIAGYYQISAVARSFVSPSGESYVQLTCNSTGIATSGSYGQINGTVSTLVCMNGTTDTLRVQILASGAGTGCIVGQGGSRFSAMLMALA